MTGASRKDVEPGSVKMGLVEKIKDLGPELQVDPLCRFEDLVCRKIDIVEPGPGDGVSCQVPIGSCRRPRKGAGVIPEIWSSQLLSCGYARAACSNSVCGIVAEARVQVGTVRRPPGP